MQFTMISSVFCNLICNDEIISRSKLLVRSDVDLSSPLFGSQRPGGRDCVHCNGQECYGHIGYIKSPYYLCNPLLISEVNNTLSRTCIRCSIIYKIKVSNCNTCGHSISNNNISVDINPEKARDILISCNSRLIDAFSNLIPVIPRMMRPNDVTCPNQYSVTNAYTNLLRACNSRNPQYKSIAREYDNLISSSSTKYNTRSIIALLKGKDGLFRSYMVGKRVDHCGRAVIVGTDLQDVNIISLPYKIYDKLRTSITVTDDNITLVQKLSSQGMLYTKKGELAHISSIVVGKRFLRNLYGEDRVLLNRQPSLSKYSLMGFKVERNNTNTIRINTSITNAYAADFDGDEMNVFYQDNDDYRNDVNNMMCVENNAECISFIQDTVTIYYKLTMYPEVVTKSLYCDSCLICDRYDIIYHDLLTTRDILSLPLPNNLSYTSIRCVINNGIISSGYLNKNDLKRLLKLVRISGYNIIDYIRKTQALVSYLTTSLYSTSIGLDDINIINREDANYITSSYVNITNPTEEELDTISSNISTASIHMIESHRNNTSLWNMVSSGAKGDSTNIVHMSLALGYQRVGGKVINEPITSSFLLGISSKEFLTHQRSSREGLVRTNVYTADVGYTTRRLCKALCTTTYHDDNTIRDNGYIICPTAPLPKTLDIDDNILSTF